MFKKILLITILLVLFTSTAFATTIFDLNFNDGLAPNGWTEDGTATWDFTNFYAKTSGNVNAGWYYDNFTVTDSNEISFAAKIAQADASSTTYVWIGTENGDPDDGSHLPNGSGYGLQCSSNSGSLSGLWKSVAGVDTRIISMADCTGSTDYVLRADRNTSDGWTLYRDNTVVGWYNETIDVVNDFNTGQFYANNGSTGNNKIDDFNFISTSLGTASFDYIVNKSVLSIDFNDTTIPPSGETITDWNWIINDSQESLDQNFVFTPITAYQDINACLNVTFSDLSNSITCQQFNIGKLFGLISFEVFDENTGLDLSGVEIDFNGTTYTANNTFDLNLNNGFITQEYTFTFTKTGYGTRYYTVDLNAFSDLNVNFALLSNSLGSDIQFKFFETDQSTLLSNADVTITHLDKNKIVSRRKTNDLAQQTFFLNANDGNYNFYIIASDGAVFDYNTVSLTISRPYSETTGLIIDANWNYVVSGLGAYADSNLDVNTAILAIYSDTVNTYNITISSNSLDPLYYNRVFQILTVGNQAVNLIPYLPTTDDATLITLETDKDNGTIVSPYPNIQIQIYKQIPGVGRSLVQEVYTAASGQATAYLIVGDTYDFELYDSSGNAISFNNNVVNSVNITAAKIYFTINTFSNTVSYIAQKIFYVTFNPFNPSVTKLATGTKTFSFVINNPDAVSMTIIGYVTQNDTNFVTYSAISSGANDTYSFTAINWSDINLGNATVTIVVTADNNIFYFTQNYVIQNAWGGGFNPIEDGLKTGMRTDLGCSANASTTCLPTLIIGVIITIALIAFISFKLPFIGGQGTAGLIVVMLAFFTYLTWVPIELTIVVALIVAAFIINERRE